MGARTRRAIGKEKEEGKAGTFSFNVTALKERKKRRRNRDNQPKKEIRAAQKKKFVGTDVEFRDVVASENTAASLVRVSQASAEFQHSFEASNG